MWNRAMNESAPSSGSTPTLRRTVAANRTRTSATWTGLLASCLFVAACGATDAASDQQLPPIATTTSTTSTTTTVPQERFYTVQRGDILAVIAAQQGVTIESIVELNGLDNPDDIQAGQVLEIPSNVRSIEPVVPETEPADATDPTTPDESP